MREIIRCLVREMRENVLQKLEKKNSNQNQREKLPIIGKKMDKIRENKDETGQMSREELKK